MVFATRTQSQTPLAVQVASTRVLLTITTTHRPATDLGFLLHKHPDRLQTFSLPFGEAHVFYPEATEERCTAALLLDIDPVGLVRRGRRRQQLRARRVRQRSPVRRVVVSLGRARDRLQERDGRDAARGTRSSRRPRSRSRSSLPAVPARGGEPLVRGCSSRSATRVEVDPIALDPMFPEWGAVATSRLRLPGELRLADLLTHLYVLLPVLDDDKHYWVDEAEIEKLMRRGEGWLAGAPRARPDRAPLSQAAGAAVLPRARPAGRGCAAGRGSRRARSRGAARGARVAARPAPRRRAVGAQGIRGQTGARPRLRRRARCSRG